LLSLFAASNHLPEDDSLRALFDRFLLRCHVENLKREELPRLLVAGWALEQSSLLESSISAEDLRALTRRVYEVDVHAVADRYAGVVSKVRDLGVALSDRRVVKILKLVAASAVLCGRKAAGISDFWVFRYVWDREEQIAPMQSLVAGVIEPHAGEADAHPLATVPNRVDGEEIARHVDAIAIEMQDHRSLSLAAVARLRERLAELSDRAAWLSEDGARTHLTGRVREMLKRLG
jgi:MoxR-like ATPase